MARKNSKKRDSGDKLLTQAESADLVELMRVRLRPYMAAVSPKLVEVLNQAMPSYSTVLQCSKAVADEARGSPAAAYRLLFSAAMMLVVITDSEFGDVTLEFNVDWLPPDRWVPVKEWMDERKLMAV